MLLALLLAAASAGKLAVLELRTRLPEKEKALIDAGYLSDAVRNGAKDRIPGLAVMTRENVLVLLESTGKKLEECEGECEVETGRRLGADFIVSGDVLKFGSSFKVNLRLHDTRTALLLQGVMVTGKSADQLDEALPKALDKLFSPLQNAAPRSDEEAGKRLVTMMAGRWDCQTKGDRYGGVIDTWRERDGGRIGLVRTGPNGSSSEEDVFWLDGSILHSQTAGGNVTSQELEWLEDGYRVVYPRAGVSFTVRRSGREMTKVHVSGPRTTETRCKLLD
jgi:hypothetical protein